MNSTSIYIKKDAKTFKRAFPKFQNHEEKIMKRKIMVFIDPYELEKLEIPNDVREKVYSYANRYLKRLNSFTLCNEIISKEDGCKYYMDLESEAYDIYGVKENRILYSVIRIVGYRLSCFNPTKNGEYQYDESKSITYHWSSSVYTPIYDLWYMGEENE